MRALRVTALVIACFSIGVLVAMEPLLAFAGVALGTPIVSLCLGPTYAVTVSAVAALYVSIPSAFGWDFGLSLPLLTIQRLLEGAALVVILARWPLIWRRLRERTALVAPWIVLFVLAAASSFWSGFPARSATAAFGTIEAPVFAMLVVWSLKSREREILGKVLMACAGVFAVVALYQVASGVSLQDMLPGLQRSIVVNVGDRGGYLRAQSLMPNAIVSGTLGSILVVYGAWRTRTDAGLWRALDYLGVVAGLILVATSQSRAAFLALGIGIATMLIAHFGMKRQWGRLAMVVLVLSIASYVAIPAVAQTFGTQSDLATGTVRAATASAVWDAALDSPSRMALGVGWGTFAQAGLQGDLFGQTANLRWADTLGVKVFAELGLVGVALLTILGFRAILFSARRRDRRRDGRGPNLPALVGVTASFLAASLGVTLLQLAQPMFAVMAILALLEIEGSADG